MNKKIRLLFLAIIFCGGSIGLFAQQSDRPKASEPNNKTDNIKNLSDYEMENQSGTSLTILVNNKKGKPVSGASVTLYSSLYDLMDRKNQLRLPLKTDSVGEVTFKNLPNSNKYFVYVEKLVQNNGGEEIENIIANKNNKFVSKLGDYGQIEIVNNTNIPIEFFLGDELDYYKNQLNDNLYVVDAGERKFFLKESALNKYKFAYSVKIGAVVTTYSYDITVGCGYTESVRLFLEKPAQITSVKVVENDEVKKKKGSNMYNNKWVSTTLAAAATILIFYLILNY